MDEVEAELLVAKVAGLLDVADAARELANQCAPYAHTDGSVQAAVSEVRVALDRAGLS